MIFTSSVASAPRKVHSRLDGASSSAVTMVATPTEVSHVVCPTGPLAIPPTRKPSHRLFRMSARKSISYPAARRCLVTPTLVVMSDDYSDPEEEDEEEVEEDLE